MGFLSTLLFNPITIVGAVYFVATRTSVSLPQRARLMGLGLGRMVSFAGSQRKNLVHLIRDNAAILEPYLQVSDELSKLSSVSSELRTFRRQQRAELVKAARRSSSAGDAPGATAEDAHAEHHANASAAGSGRDADAGSVSSPAVSSTSPLFVSVAEQHSGGADLVDQAILASELARVRHAEPARNDTALRRPTASRPAEAPE